MYLESGSGEQLSSPLKSYIQTLLKVENNHFYMVLFILNNLIFCIVLYPKILAGKYGRTIWTRVAS